MRGWGEERKGREEGKRGREERKGREEGKRGRPPQQIIIPPPFTLYPPLIII